MRVFIRSYTHVPEGSNQWLMAKKKNIQMQKLTTLGFLIRLIQLSKNEKGI